MDTPAYSVCERVPYQESLKLHIWPSCGFHSGFKYLSGFNSHYTDITLRSAK